MDKEKNAFVIKSKTLEDGYPARTLCVKGEDAILVKRTYLIPERELVYFKECRVVRKFKDKLLINTYIVFKKQSMATMIKLMLENNFL